MIVFIYGPPASGKTTVGEKISRELAGFEFFDLDRCIEIEVGKTIPAIFKEYGELRFRELESEVLEKIIKKHQNRSLILSLGGGTLLDERNRKLCENFGIVFLLEPPSEDELARRIASKPNSRPLGNKLAERAVHYASFPNHFLASDIEPILEYARKSKI